jgi:predicted secreted protein
VKTSTAVLLGLAGVAVVGVGYYLLSQPPAAAQKPAQPQPPQLPTLNASLPTNIPLLEGAQTTITLPDVPSTGYVWQLVSSDTSIATITDLGDPTGTVAIGTVQPHSFIVTATAVGQATLTATLLGPNGQLVATQPALTCTVSVVANIASGGPSGFTLNGRSGPGAVLTPQNIFRTRR